MNSSIFYMSNALNLGMCLNNLMSILKPELECNTFGDGGIFLDNDLEEFFQEHNISIVSMNEGLMVIEDSYYIGEILYTTIKNRHGDDLGYEDLIDFNTLNINRIRQLDNRCLICDNELVLLSNFDYDFNVIGYSFKCEKCGCYIDVGYEV